MDKKITYVLIAAVLIIVVAGVAVFATGNSDDTAEEKDTYYLFLDGIGDDKIGWYTGEGSNADEGYRAALDNSKIPYEINDKGWINTINGIKGDATHGFGVFGYVSTVVDKCQTYSFYGGPVITDLNTNIAYICYSEFDSKTYAMLLNPTNTKAAGFQDQGPFAKDSGYKAIDYGNEYSIYLDGMGDISKWYTGTGDNALVALKNALDTNKIAYNITDSGWINSINGVAGSATTGYSVWTFMSDDTVDAKAFEFGKGPVINEVTGNIIYLSFGTFDANYNVDPSPSTSKAGDLLTGGPFAA